MSNFTPNPRFVKHKFAKTLPNIQIKSLTDFQTWIFPGMMSHTTFLLDGNEYVLITEMYNGEPTIFLDQKLYRLSKEEQSKVIQAVLLGEITYRTEHPERIKLVIDEDRVGEWRP